MGAAGRSGDGLKKDLEIEYTYAELTLSLRYRVGRAAIENMQVWRGHVKSSREERGPAATLSAPGAFVKDDNSIGLLDTAYDGAMSAAGEQGWERNEKGQFRCEGSSVMGVPRLGFGEATNVRPVTPGKLYY